MPLHLTSADLTVYEIALPPCSNRYKYDKNVLQYFQKLTGKRFMACADITGMISMLCIQHFCVCQTIGEPGQGFLPTASLFCGVRRSLSLHHCRQAAYCMGCTSTFFPPAPRTTACTDKRAAFVMVSNTHSVPPQRTWWS